MNQTSIIPGNEIKKTMAILFNCHTPLSPIIPVIWVLNVDNDNIFYCLLSSGDKCLKSIRIRSDELNSQTHYSYLEQALP